jgi:predicted TIM-barrel fold metal-dependent hydrolase
MRDIDRLLLAEIEELLPERLFDVHVHVWRRDDLGASAVAGFGHWLTRDQYLGADLAAEFAHLFPGRTCSALLFPLPVADGDVTAMNRYLADLVRAEERRFGLMIPPLDASAEELSRLVAAGGFLGFKPYWTFAGSDLRSTSVNDFVTPAMLAAAHELRLIVMLHPPGNLPPHQGAIREAALRYPGATFILPHCATCYHYAALAAGIDSVSDLANVHFDLSTVTAGDVVSLLLREVGRERVMFGTDFPFASERMTLAYLESGLVPLREATAPPPPAGRRYAFSYLIYEQLRALRAARDLQRLTAAEVEAIMYGNAERLIQRTAAGG